MVHTITLQVKDIRYSQDSIHFRFSDTNTPVNFVDPDDLPTMEVVYHEGDYYTLNNRTLYAWKYSYHEEKKIYVDVVKKTHKFWNKFTTDCDGEYVDIRNEEHSSDDTDESNDNEYVFFDYTVPYNQCQECYAEKAYGCRNNLCAECCGYRLKDGSRCKP